MSDSYHALIERTVPTAPCFKPGGISGQTTTFGLAIGGGKIDPECEQQMKENGLRATAAMLFQAGQYRLGVLTLCAIRSEQEALGASCVYIEPAAAPTVRYVTPEQLREVEQRMTRKLVTK